MARDDGEAVYQRDCCSVDLEGSWNVKSVGSQGNTCSGSFLQEIFVKSQAFRIGYATPSTPDDDCVMVPLPLWSPTVSRG